MPRVVTVSESSKRDIHAQMGVSSWTASTSCPSVSTRGPSGRSPRSARVPGRLMTTTSSDVPMKGLAPLLEALAKVRTERDDAELVIIGKPKDEQHDPRASSSGSASSRRCASCRA